MGTRGVGYIFVEGIDRIVLYSSTEFNGNMDLEGYGYEFLDRLSRVQNTTDFVKEMREFNEEHFDYMEDMMYKAVSNKEGCMDMNGELYFDYIEQSSIHFKLFEKYTEDYSYIKNATKQTLMIGCKNGVVLLKPNQTMVCNFGRFVQNADRLEELEIIEWTGEQALCEKEKEYTVKIEETRTYIIRVQAKSEEEAEDLAKQELECGNFDEEWESEHEMYCYVEEVSRQW